MSTFKMQFFSLETDDPAAAADMIARALGNLLPAAPAPAVASPPTLPTPALEPPATPPAPALLKPAVSAPLPALPEPPDAAVPDAVETSIEPAIEPASETPPAPPAPVETAQTTETPPATPDAQGLIRCSVCKEELERRRFFPTKDGTTSFCRSCARKGLPTAEAEPAPAAAAPPPPKATTVSYRDPVREGATARHQEDQGIVNAVCQAICERLRRGLHITNEFEGGLVADFNLPLYRVREIRDVCMADWNGRRAADSAKAPSHGA